MQRKQFEDAPGGDTITYDVTDDGFRQCTFGLTVEDHQKYFDNLPNIKCDEKDILLNSYPKTGTNWLWEMLLMVLSKTSEVTGGIKGPGMLEAVPPEVTEQLPPPRLLNTHLKIKYLPKQAIEKRLKMVLLLRNPKDVVVSFYVHTKGIRPYEYDGKFENYLQMFMRGEVDYGSYPEYLKEWQTFIRKNPDYPVHVLYYEDLKKDCLGEMVKVCAFLGLEVEKDLLRQIVDNCQIDKLRQGKIENMSEELKGSLGKVLKNNFTVYRKGQIGDWKNWFTVAQNEAFEQWWDNETKDVDMFNFRYT